MTRWTYSALAAAVTLSIAPFAFAKGEAKPPAKQPPPAAPAPAPAAKSAGSLAEIEAAADEAEVAARKDLRRKRYQAIAAYAAANPTAKDAESALAAAMDLAEELEDWAKATDHADAYIKAFAEGDRKTDALITKAAGLSELGKKEEAKKAYEAVFALEANKVDPNTLVNTYAVYASALVDQGDVEGAKAVYQKLKDAFSEHQASGQVARIAEDWSKSLDLIGTEPTPFPETSKDLDGKPVSLADYKGKVLLIDFWATWCPPCRAEIPNIVKAYEKFHDKGFEVLGVSLDHEVDKLKEYVKDKKMAWRQVYDEGKEFREAYGVEGIPHILLIGRDGKIIRLGLRGNALHKALDRAFAAK